MKKAITNLVLIGLGIIVINPFGGIMIGIGSCRLLFQLVEWALEGGEAN